MKFLARGIFIIAALLLACSGVHALENGGSPAAPPGQITVPVYLFWTATCPHCAKAREFLKHLSTFVPRMHLRAYELPGEDAAERAFIALSRQYRIEPPAVPLIIVGDTHFAGFDEDTTTGKDVETAVRACLSGGCADSAGLVIARAEAGLEEPPPPEARPTELPAVIRMPLLGEIETRSLSLPVLTILLGAIDGFNPCAMWVLVFLIGLLVGMRSPVKMWSYGAAFLIASGAVYFALMAAWLNLFLFLGALAWIRMAVGVFALGAGAYYLREFVRNPGAVCQVTSPGQRQRVMDRFRAVVSNSSFGLAILGIMVLAAAVNTVELMCSAGIPAVYTQVLALSGLSTPAYYGYLLLYIIVFMLDDAVVCITAMLTLRATGFTANYSRASHLIGGVVLLVIGLLLILKPEWLAFI
jgi:glutaredoxin